MMAEINIKDYDGGPLVLMPIDGEVSERNKDGFFQKYWRPAVAALYLMLCLLDYGVRPLVNQYYAKQFDLSATVEAIKPLEPSVQVKALEIAARNEIWPPILNDMVHLAFGAILSAAATTRGMEKIQRAKNGKG